ncbi:hypothetical protein TRICI_001449 [Trichomonascus ciferrii]|uniref:Uncharacterized protein n=1 Tax=Trichomonascus ciferrii TaxID=44093 RepID=A0A642VCF0_9ASCO|nr:hypothetical protein TRICI_001449 [Trichomonascus ciferrii]
MILSEQYRLVSQAKSKLTREARRMDPDLRVLVVHANVLDGLMEEIQRGREQRKNPQNHSVHFDDSIETQKAAAIATQSNSDDYDYYSDSDSSSEEEDSDSDYDEYEDDEEEEIAIAYTTNNKSCQQMPILEEEEVLPHLTYSSESEDEDDDSPEEDNAPFHTSTTSIQKVQKVHLSSAQPLEVA